MTGGGTGRRVLLHIGTEKTGTTTLQTVLAHSGDQLSRAGIHYVCTPEQVMARDVASAAAGDGYDEYLEMEMQLPRAEWPAFAADVRRRLGDEAASLGADVHTVIVSSEHFHSRLVDLDQVRRLADLVGPFGDRIEVLCYLRPQTELVTSHYSTRLRMGETRTLDEVGASLLRNDVAYADYLGLLDRFATVFGEEAVSVRVYGRDQLVGGDIVTDFAAVAGLEADQLASADLGRRNTSISSSGQHVLRTLNERGGDLGPAADPIALAAMIARSFPGRGDRLSDEMLARAEQEFAADNEEIRRRWRPDLVELFPSGAAGTRPPGHDRHAGRPAERVHRSPDAARIEELSSHVAELEADVAWLNRELNQRPVAAVRRLARRPASRSTDPRRT